VKTNSSQPTSQRPRAASPAVSTVTPSPDGLNPELSVWRFSAFGGVTLSGDPEAPGEVSSQIGAMTGSHTLLAKLKAMESPELSADAKG
jgi:hypothetical protein